jgi:hypothetical protein
VNGVVASAGPPWLTAAVVKRNNHSRCADGHFRGRSDARQHLDGLAQQDIIFAVQFVHPTVERYADVYTGFPGDEFVGFDPEET